MKRVLFKKETFGPVFCITKIKDVDDAIRLAKIALDDGIGGPIIPASAYLMKHPIKQMSDTEAKAECEKFVAGND